MSDPVTAPLESFFVSYTGVDRERAEWIAWVLEEAGYDCKVQAWDFHPGGNFVVDMQEAAAKCDRTIAVLSEAYLKSGFTAAEWAAAFAVDPDGKSQKLVPVRIAPFRPEGLFRSLVYIDFVGVSEDEAKARLLAGLRRERAKPATKPAFTVIPPATGSTPPTATGASATTPSPTALASGTAAIDTISLRRLLTRRLSLGEVGTLWFDMFGETINNALPTQGLVQCVIELIAQAERRPGSFDRMLESLKDSRSDLYPEVKTLIRPS